MLSAAPCTILMCYTTLGGAAGGGGERGGREGIIHKEYNQSVAPMPTCLNHWIKGAMYNDLRNSRLAIGMHLNFTDYVDRNKGVFW